jgi:hypothetical protein
LVLPVFAFGLANILPILTLSLAAVLPVLAFSLAPILLVLALGFAGISVVVTFIVPAILPPIASMRVVVPIHHVDRRPTEYNPRTDGWGVDTKSDVHLGIRGCRE